MWMIFCHKQRYEKKKKKHLEANKILFRVSVLRELLNKANIYFVNTESVGLPR